MSNRNSTDIIAELTNLFESQSQPGLDTFLRLFVCVKLWAILDRSHFQKRYIKKLQTTVQKYKKSTIHDLPFGPFALKEPLSCVEKVWIFTMNL